MFLKAVIFLGILGLIWGKDEVPIPTATSVSQTPGFRTQQNLTYTVTCQAVNSTNDGTMTLVAVSAKGSAAAGTSQSGKPSGSTLYKTTLTANVTVMSGDTDTYVCNIVYTDKDKTSKNSTTISLVNNGTGVTVSQTSGSQDPGMLAGFEAVIDKSRLEKGSHISRTTWMVNNETVCTYNASKKDFAFDDNVGTACGINEKLQTAFLNITTSNCYSDQAVTCVVVFNDSQTGSGKTPFEVNGVTKPATQKPQIYVGTEDKPWSFLFECDVTNVTDKVTNITLITKEKYQNQKFVPSYDKKTCLYGGSFTANVTIPYGSCATYQCKTTYKSANSTEDDPYTYCNNVTANPKPSAVPRDSSHLRMTEVWNFTFTCNALETPSNGTLTLVAGKDNKGSHSDDRPVTVQNTTTNLWDNSLISQVLVPLGDDGKSQCDTYSCNIMYNKTIVQGDPVQYCNNGTGVTIEKQNGTLNVGDTAKLTASFNADIIGKEVPDLVEWYYGTEKIYFINKTSGKNGTSGDHGKQIKHVDTDFKTYSHLSFEVTYCDIDTASLSCHLTTKTPHTGVGKESLKINRNFSTAVPMKPPEYKVTTNKTWAFTFECDVTGATQNVTNITLVTKSTNHTKPEITFSYNSTSCLYSAKLTADVTIGYNTCIDYSCNVEYSTFNKTVEGESRSYCNKITYPAAVAHPADIPKLRTTSNLTVPFTCGTPDKTQENATITLVPVSAKGKHTGDNSTSVPDTKKLFTNTLTSTITVPAGINGTSQCDTYRCDIAYADGTKTNGTAQAYCNNGTGVKISQSPDLVEINGVVDFNASFVALGTGDEAVNVTWYYNDELIYVFNKTGNYTFGKHVIVQYDTESHFRYSYIELNVSACDVSNYVMCELRTQNSLGNFTKMIDIKPVLKAPVMMETPNHTVVEAQVWNFNFCCTVEGATEAPNLTLSGAHHSDKVYSNYTYDHHTCLYSGLLYTNVSLPYGTCVDYICTAVYEDGTVSSKKTSYCNGESSEKMKKWQLALIVMAVIVVVACVVSAVVYVVRKKRRAARDDENERLINDPTVS